MDVRHEAIKEMAIREILKRNQDKHDSLFCYLQTMYEKEMKKEYNALCYHNVIQTPELNLSIDYAIKIADN